LAAAAAAAAARPTSLTAGAGSEAKPPLLLLPLQVTVKQQKSEFLHFVTNVCAILGGVFTVAGILDAFIYHSEKAIRKKMELGKFN
jgi:hypothetical protein